MNKLTMILIFCVIAGSCKTYSYFTTPNNLLNQNCQVLLLDGTKFEGKLTINFETGHNVRKYVTILTKDHIEKQVPVTDIKYYKFNNDRYYPKELNLESYEIPARDKLYLPNVNNLLFVKELTKEDARMHLFELFQSRANSMDGMDHYDYYISFNEENRFHAWSIRGSKFFPNFEDKMSSLVADCPALSAKIRQKAGGYSLKQVSIDAKKELVIKRIVEEYNECK